MQIAFSTAFSDLLESRPTCLAISATLGAHFSLVALGLPSWQCPVRYGLGIPCPGCGLSRAMVALVHGDWHHMLLVHAFAPIAIVAIALIVICGLLFQAQRQFLIKGIRYLEKRIGMTAFFLAGLMLYWIIRLLFFNKILYELVM